MKKFKNQNQKGITLVALVVTIVVLLILSGVSIVTLFGENGIITAAQKVAEQTKNSVNKDLEELKELEGMLTGWQEVKNEKGQVIAVEKGSQKVEIGDYINYDCTKNASGQEVTESYTSYAYGKENNDHDGRTSGYSEDQKFKASDYKTSESDSKAGKWRVLGAENGELLIMTAKNVSSIRTAEKFYLATSNGKSYAEQGKAAYKYGIEELDNISKIYAKGKGAAGEARSIKVEDVNDITGYEPEKTGNGSIYGAGKLWEYNNKVTYTWKGGTAPDYSGNKGTITGTLSDKHNTEEYGFTYWDENANSWVRSPYISTAQTSEITTLETIGYNYYPETLTSIENRSADTGILHNSKQYDMLFGNSNSQYYWLGSRYVSTSTMYVAFSYRNVYYGGVAGSSLFYSYGSGVTGGYGVRPVVSLKSDIKLEKATTDENGYTTWNIK